MTAPPARYYVHGIELVNCGGEMCDACGVRMAVGRSISGHTVCGRCAGWAAHEASEFAQELAASRLRRAVERERVRRITAAPTVPEIVPPHLAARRLQAGIQTTARNRERADALTHFGCGHERTRENTYKSPLGRRACIVCRRVRGRQQAEQKRARKRRVR